MNECLLFSSGSTHVVNRQYEKVLSHHPERHGDEKHPSLLAPDAVDVDERDVLRDKQTSIST